jgi:hypothetical protein
MGYPLNIGVALIDPLNIGVALIECAAVIEGLRSPRDSNAFKY